MNKMNGKTLFKVDLAKAYDRLQWSFVHEVLKEVGLPLVMIDFTMHSIFEINSQTRKELNENK